MSVRVLGALAAMPVWVLISVVVSALQLGLVIYNAMRIALDLAFFWLAGVLRSVAVWLGSPWSFTSYRRRVAAMERELHACDTHAKWLSAAERLDELEGHDTWRREVGEGLFDWRLVGATLSKLRQARKAGDTQELMFLLGSALHRRFGSIDRSALYHYARAGTKLMVERFVNECVAAVRAIADAPAAPPGAAKPTEVGDPVGDAPYPAPSPSPARPATAQDRFEFFEGARLAVGRTALCLSGGGALAMYHMGVVKALLEAGVMPRIVSGTSGGAIIAGLLALHTDREMLDHVISPDITDRYGVPWFDPLPTQVRTFASSLLTADRPYIMSSERFARACRSCFGKTTFADAFRRTGRVVSIVITVRYGSGGGGASSTHPFLVNYLTCPNVYVWSAVAASCALPGLMPAANLLARPHTAATPPPPPTPGPSPRDTPGGDDADGSSDGPSCDPSPPAPGSDAASSAPDEVPFHPRGVDSLDGSMQSDIPCDALARMFHVNRFVTSQVNPHVAPFLREDHHSPSLPPAPSTAGSPDADGSAAASASLPGPGARPGVASLLSQIRLWLTLDVQYRTRRLARMQLLPRFFGADLSGVFTQRYRGHVTISPHMTLFDQCKALSHPSREDMARYIRQGELATWPKLAHIRTLVAAEKELSRAEHSPPHHRLPPSRDSTDRGGSRHHTPGRTPARAGRRQPDRDLGGSLGAWGGALLEQVEEEAAAASPGLHVDGMVAMPADGFVTPAAVSESGGPGDGEDEEEEGGAAARGGARPTHRDWRSSLGPHMVTALRLSPGGRAELRRSQAAMAAEEAALTHRPRAVTQG